MNPYVQLVPHLPTEGQVPTGATHIPPALSSSSTARQARGIEEKRLENDLDPQPIDICTAPGLDLVLRDPLRPPELLQSSRDLPRGHPVPEVEHDQPRVEGVQQAHHLPLVPEGTLQALTPEMRGIRDSNGYEHTTNLTNTILHLSTMKSGSGSTIPPAPRKLPNHRDRLLTRDADEPVDQNCQIMTAMPLANRVPNQLSLVQTKKNGYLGKALCIDTKKYNIYNAVLHTQDLQSALPQLT